MNTNNLFKYRYYFSLMRPLMLVGLGGNIGALFILLTTWALNPFTSCILVLWSVFSIGGAAVRLYLGPKIKAMEAWIVEELRIDEDGQGPRINKVRVLK